MIRLKLDQLRICEPISYGFKFSPVSFHPPGSSPPEDAHVAAAMKTLAQENLGWFDAQLRDRSYLCGDRYSLADILLYVFLDFGNTVGQPLNPEFANINAWFKRVAERPSAKA